MTGSVAGILLAAGGSRRLGEPKQLLRDDHGETLVHRAARLLLEAGCTPVVVVTGSHAVEVFSSIEDLEVDIFHNPDWETGIGGSIAAGIAHLVGRTAAETPAPSGVLLAACDMPTVSLGHFEALLSASEEGSIRTASTYQNDMNVETRGIPAVFPQADWPALMALQGDRGAKALLQNGAPVTVLLDGGRFDIDTPEDARRWHLAGRTISPSPHLAMSTLVKTVLADLEAEFANTRRMLERIPSDQLDFKPHEKSWTLGQLANHVTDFPYWGEFTLASTGLNFDEPWPAKAQPANREQFLTQWDERVAAFLPLLAKATDEDLQATWTATAGGHPVIQMSRIAVLRGMVLNHMIHHRAQLSIYFRLTGVPLPGLYGPSADEA